MPLRGLSVVPTPCSSAPCSSVPCPLLEIPNTYYLDFGIQTPNSDTGYKRNIFRKCKYNTSNDVIAVCIPCRILKN